MIIWPDSLIREIGRRRVFLFLGAGVSASSKDKDGNSPKTWAEFLTEACALISNEENKLEVNNLISNKSYLLALQAIQDLSNPADYDALMSKHFNNAKFKASRLHEIILDLDLETIITTNFDKIYENYCQYTSEDGYKVLNYESKDLGDLLRSDTRLIIKAHGCINNARSMVFTRAQYHKAKKENQPFYDILKAIFLTHTCIFIGCSMDDPDIQLTLEDVNITSSSNFPHYLLAKNGVNSEICKKDWVQTYNIATLEYGPGHENLAEDLENLKASVDMFRDTNR